MGYTRLVRIALLTALLAFGPSGAEARTERASPDGAAAATAAAQRAISSTLGSLAGTYGGTPAGTVLAGLRRESDALVSDLESLAELAPAARDELKTELGSRMEALGAALSETPVARLPADGPAPSVAHLTAAVGGLAQAQQTARAALTQGQTGDRTEREGDGRAEPAPGPSGPAFPEDPNGVFNFQNVRDYLAAGGDPVTAFARQVEAERRLAPPGTLPTNHLGSTAMGVLASQRGHTGWGTTMTSPEDAAKVGALLLRAGYEQEALSGNFGVGGSEILWDFVYARQRGPEVVRQYLLSVPVPGVEAGPRPCLQFCESAAGGGGNAGSDGGDGSGPQGAGSAPPAAPAGSSQPSAPDGQRGRSERFDAPTRAGATPTASSISERQDSGGYSARSQDVPSARVAVEPGRRVPGVSCPIGSRASAVRHSGRLYAACLRECPAGQSLTYSFEPWPAHSRREDSAGYATTGCAAAR